MMELLAPAGGYEALTAAVQNGADAVYMGFGAFNARRSAKNFTDEEFASAVRCCHLRGVRVFLTLNTLLTDRELPGAAAALRKASAMGVDAVLVQDWGLLTLAKEIVPDLPLHASTQMSLFTLGGANAAAALGMERVVLARELDRDEVREICAGCGAEIEVFGHGALCMCYSGQCEMSAVLGQRSGNRGACAQPCRYQYALMEEKRPGEYFPVFEDEKGTYIMNSRDMCMIDHLDDLMDAGVDCLKIEGRAKSAYYAAIVTGAYRHAIDDVAQGRPVDPVWRDEVEHVSHRHYSTGFFYGPPGQYYESSRYIRDWQICAVVTDCTPEGLATLSLRNKFRTGDTVEVVGPDTRPFSLTVPEMADADGLPLFEPKTPQMTFTMPLPRPVPPMSFIRHAVELSGK